MRGSLTARTIFSSGLLVSFVFKSCGFVGVRKNILVVVVFFQNAGLWVVVVPVFKLTFNLLWEHSCILGKVPLCHVRSSDFDFSPPFFCTRYLCKQ